jgi:hypothetical protein
VVFLFNPFDRDLVALTVERLADAVHGTNRVIFLIYECPVHSDVVDAAGLRGGTATRCRMSATTR